MLPPFDSSAKSEGDFSFFNEQAMRTKILTGLLFGFMLFLWQCQGCKDKNCGSGYRFVGDVCQCQPGKYEENGICRELALNEYYGNTVNCNCQDSAFFLVNEKSINPSDGRTVVRIQQSYGHPGNINVFDLGFYYYATPTGDSLVGAFSIPGCAPIDGIPTHTYASWVKYINADTLRLTLINETVNYPYQYDTCIWYLHK